MTAQHKTRKYTELTKGLYKFVKPLIDFRDCGKKVNGEPKSLRTSASMEIARAGKSYPIQPITQTHLQEHLSNVETYYYRASRKADRFFLCVDIDDKEGIHGDATAIANWMNDRFFMGGGYVEASTNLKGAH